MDERVESRPMVRKDLGWVALGVWLCACAHEPPASSSGSAGEGGPRGISIVLPVDGSPATPGVTEARAAYGLGRAAAWKSLRGQTLNDSGDDFVIELSSWTLALGIWRRTWVPP